MLKSLFPFSRHRFNNELILDELPLEVLDILLKDQEYIPFRKGEIIFKEGIHPQGAFYIRKGKVKKYTNGFEGREYVFYISVEREIIGHHGILSNETNPNSAAALTDCELVFIPKKNFLSALKVSEDFLLKAVKNLSHEFGVFVHFAKILAQYNVRERISLTLLIVNEKFIEGGSLDAVIDMSREELASMTATAKENLVRILTEFKNEGIIATKGRGIIIKDFDALIKMSKYFD